MGRGTRAALEESVAALLCSRVSAAETPTCLEDPNLQVWNLNIGLSHYILISKQSLMVPWGQQESLVEVGTE